MQMLSHKTIIELEAKGLTLFGKKGKSIRVGKPVSIDGNCIEWDVHQPFTEIIEVDGKYESKLGSFKTDAPILGVWIEESGFRVSVWQWSPGPGPGDFDDLVYTEEEVCQRVINYFFEDNDYFISYRKWKSENRE